MRYPKKDEADKNREENEQLLANAALIYQESNSFDEFKVKLAAAGIDSFAVKKAFKTYYNRRNNESGEPISSNYMAAEPAFYSILVVIAAFALLKLLFGISWFWLFLAPVFVMTVFIFSASTIDIYDRIASKAIRENPLNNQRK